MSQYVDPKDARKSYRPVSGTMSEGLKRARAPYRVRNAIVGLGLGAFGVGVWAYSISAVKQDVFDDVDEEAKSLRIGTNDVNNTAATAVHLDATTSVATVGAGVAVVPAPVVVTPNSTLPVPPAERSTPADSRGILQSIIGNRWPRILDPGTKTVVWGAPPVDNIGRMGSSSNELS